MKRNLILFLAVMLLLTGCGKAKPMYTNLADTESQQEVAQALEACGISPERTGQLMQQAEDFNTSAENYTFAGKFRELPQGYVDYSSVLLDDRSEHYEYLQCLNCRIAMFQLLRDQITTAGNGDERDMWLMFDVDAIDTVPQLQLTGQERMNFITVFNQIPVSGTLDAHTQAITQAWQDRQIQVGGEGLSLVCVYLHDPDGKVRFVGHAGVLAESQDGLLFVEKISPLDPFQATRFSSRKELKEYLLSRPDLYGDINELAPIVVENGVVL